MLKFLLCFIVLIPSLLNAQGAKVSGRVFNSLNNAPLAFATIKIINEQIGAVSAEDGTFEIADLSPGVYSFKATAAGFKTFYLSEVSITKTRVEVLEFSMEELFLEQEEVTVTASPFLKRKESPVSLKTLNATEIERLPGANSCLLYTSDAADE